MPWLLLEFCSYRQFRSQLGIKSLWDLTWMSGVLDGRPMQLTLTSVMEKCRTFSVISADGTWMAEVDVNGREIGCRPLRVIRRNLAQFEIRSDRRYVQKM